MEDIPIEQSPNTDIPIEPSQNEERPSIPQQIINKQQKTPSFSDALPIIPNNNGDNDDDINVDPKKPVIADKFHSRKIAQYGMNEYNKQFVLKCRLD